MVFPDHTHLLFCILVKKYVYVKHGTLTCDMVYLFACLLWCKIKVHATFSGNYYPLHRIKYILPIRHLHLRFSSKYFF